MENLYKSVVSLSEGRAEMKGAAMRCVTVGSGTRSEVFNPFSGLVEVRGREANAGRRMSLFSTSEEPVSLFHQLSGRSQIISESYGSVTAEPGDVCLLFPGMSVGYLDNTLPDDEYWGIRVALAVEKDLHPPADIPVLKKEKDIPVYRGNDGVIVKILAGSFRGYSGLINRQFPALYLDIHIPPLSTFTHSVPENETTFAYILEGRGETPNLPGGMIGESNILLFREGGDTVSFTSGDEELRIVLGSGFGVNVSE